MDAPTDTQLIDWIGSHPYVNIRCADGWWRVAEDRVNGYGCSSQHLRIALELAMLRVGRET